ncbi:pentachlorophenol monooxygenase [Maritimibacter sp. 55A14]|uniref:FAD-dependent oxidoreductase n=1 Tax=Maritimibacter sp. 55A14 TaxID=2174844 RepID=UPI000D60BAD2|nr:FAD-dependent monooxygenase [Maritimibacter sp. 55A14]PWE33970.1 pentachlorophenol monooxygenase [Maritimibacter sp. 55A14]
MTGRILIVGAGPTGLTAAVELVRRGQVPEVIDRKLAPSPLSRAVGILPSSMRILAPSGAADAIRDEAIAVPRAFFHLGRHRFGSLRFDRDPDPDRRLFALAQDRTETHLRAAFEHHGGRVRFGAELESLEEREDHVRVRISGAEARFSHVIGADGVGSRVREELGIAFDGFDLPETWSIADVDAADWRDPQAFQMFLLARGRGVIVVPLESARFRVISNTPDALAALPVAMDVRAIRRSDTFTISIRQVARYATARVFLAGDAAHCHSPVGGRGMNLGISDAADLARRFAEGGLEGYHDCRHAAGARVICQSEWGRRLLLGGNTLRRGAARAGLGLAAALPPLERLLVARILEG